MINPMVVDGQIQGGVAQGDWYRPLRAARIRRKWSVSDRHIDGLSSSNDAGCPHGRDRPIETPYPYTPLGIKGMGEGGAIAPPAAIANAVADALTLLGARVNDSADTGACIEVHRARADRVETVAGVLLSAHVREEGSI
jgi:aerobic carbon-monoxide dehydrogenase large subunit